MQEEKKVYLLLKAIIYHYHGLDEDEKADLIRSAKRLRGKDELKWVLSFISNDHLSAFERARVYLNDIIGDYPREKRVELIGMVWRSNNLKGYVTEMEATAMLKLAHDWRVEKELIKMIKE